MKIPEKLIIYSFHLHFNQMLSDVFDLCYIWFYKTALIAFILSLLSFYDVI